MSTENNPAPSGAATDAEIGLFPIMVGRYGTPKSYIPWDVIAPHERQAQANHSQSLTRLAERGGLSPSEAVAVLEDRAWRRMDEDAAARRLAVIAAAVTPAGRVSPEPSGWQPLAEWQPLTPTLLRELAVEVRTFGREPSVWAFSPENLARRLEEAADALARGVQTSAE